MKIEYLGHACFKITSADGTLVIDPYKDGSVDGLAPLRTSADKVICTHEHADHFGTECVSLSGNECNMKITSIPSWHDDKQGALRGPNMMYVIESEGLRIAHIGDLGCMLNDEQAAQLQDLDVLMIPVGGYFTINAEQAYEITEMLSPKCIIPMHYRGDGFGYEVLATVDEFLAIADGHQEIGKEMTVGEQSGVIVMSF